MNQKPQTQAVQPISPLLLAYDAERKLMPQSASPEVVVTAIAGPPVDLFGVPFPEFSVAHFIALERLGSPISKFATTDQPPTMQDLMIAAVVMSIPADDLNRSMRQDARFIGRMTEQANDLAAKLPMNRLAEVTTAIKKHLAQAFDTAVIPGDAGGTQEGGNGQPDPTQASPDAAASAG